MRTPPQLGHRRRLAVVLAVALALVVAACGGNTAATYPPITVIADASQVSALPASVGGGGDLRYQPLDLSSLGDNVSSSALPSSIPAGVEVGFTEEGYPYRGSPDAAVTMVEFSDYACPFCARYTGVNVPQLLADYVVSGDVRFVFREFPLVSLHPTAPVAHAGAYCAGEQSAALYWDVHDAVFEGQGDWSGLSDPTDVIRSYAEGVGVDMDAFDECTASGRADAVIAKGVEDGQALGFNGTPSFQLSAEGVEGTFNIIGAQAVEVFRSYFDQLLSGEAPTDPEPEPGETPEPPGLPVWADVTSGLRPDPDRPGVNLAGDHYKGNPDAAVVVIEFSDFQCPFCRDHAVEVQPTLDAEFVDTGQILWVYKHLPLAIHPQAPAAAAAAECAGDQGQFWEMYHLLFENVDEWSEGDTDAALVDVAARLPLDVSTFEACFDGRDALERVLADQNDARGIVSQTPSFVIIIGDRGALQEGSLPVDQFVTSLQARLEQAREVSGG